MEDLTSMEGLHKDKAKKKKKHTKMKLLSCYEHMHFQDRFLQYSYKCIL